MEQLSREQRINILQRLYEVWADQNNQVIDEISITEKKETQCEMIVDYLQTHVGITSKEAMALVVPEEEE